MNNAQTNDSCAPFDYEKALLTASDEALKRFFPLSVVRDKILPLKHDLIDLTNVHHLKMMDVLNESFAGLRIGLINSVLESVFVQFMRVEKESAITATGDKLHHAVVIAASWLMNQGHAPEDLAVVCHTTHGNTFINDVNCKFQFADERLLNTAYVVAKNKKHFGEQLLNEPEFDTESLWPAVSVHYDTPCYITDSIRIDIKEST